MSNKKSFTEIQKFTQWWLWLPLGGIAIFSVYILIKQLGYGIPVGDNPMSDLGLIIYGIVITLFLGMFAIMHLKTEINKEGICIHFSPFIKKSISWDEVLESEIIQYGFVGGWGIRLGTKYGTVYNIKGNKGLALTLKSGKKILIGTQKEFELNKLLFDINNG